MLKSQRMVVELIRYCVFLLCLSGALFFYAVGSWWYLFFVSMACASYNLLQVMYLGCAFKDEQRENLEPGEGEGMSASALRTGEEFGKSASNLRLSKELTERFGSGNKELR